MMTMMQMRSLSTLSKHPADDDYDDDYDNFDYLDDYDDNVDDDDDDKDKDGVEQPEETTVQCVVFDSRHARVGKMETHLGTSISISIKLSISIFSKIVILIRKNDQNLIGIIKAFMGIINTLTRK